MPVSRTVGDVTVTVHDDSRQRCEVWSRIMGYFRPVSEWNAGKASEFKDRVFYTVDAPALNGGQQRLEV